MTPLLSWKPDSKVFCKKIPVFFGQVETRDPRYGNTGCGVFKRGYKIRKVFAKNQHTQRKLLNF